jgi:membrane protease YdiL (CAAX protease family)
MVSTSSPGAPGSQRETWGRLISTILLALVPIGVFTYGALALVIAAGWARLPANRVAAFLIGAAVGELAALGLVAWRLHRRGRTLRDLGWGRSTNWQAIVLGVVVAVVYSGWTVLNLHLGSHLLEFSWLKLIAIVVALVAGVVEETIFRGYVMTSLADMGYGLFVQTLLSGLLFGLVHFYGFGGLSAALAVQGVTLLLGIALAIIYLIGKRSLTPVIIGHALIDLIVEPWLLLTFFR